MAKRANQKLKLLVLKQVLEQQSDEAHPLSVAQLIEALDRWGIQAERKSVYDDLEALRAFGLDIQCRKGRSGGWFLGQRDFEAAELKLLVDAVQASRFITEKKSAALIGKLEKLVSRYDAKMLQRQVYVSGRAKALNEGIYYNVDKLHTALSENRAVAFRYFEQNLQKERVYRREGAFYQVSPLGLIWDNENYYLVGHDRDKGDVRHYRVDKMAELQLTALPRAAGQEFDLATYAQKHFGMYSGEECSVTLRCRRSLVGVVLDRFGQEVILVPDGDEHFTVTVRVVVSPQFWGWLFGLGGDAAILSPASAREEYARWLQASLSACTP